MVVGGVISLWGLEREKITTQKDDYRIAHRLVGGTTINKALEIK